MKTKVTNIIFGLFGSLLIASLGYWLIYPWFLGNGPANLGSIEVSYVSMGRFIRDFYPHLSFAPYWYFGFPFHLFYTPLLPAGEVILNLLFGLPLWRAYRIISGGGLVLAPVSLFFLAWGLSQKKICGILAALLYIFSPTIFYFLPASKEVAGDIITNSSVFFDPRRLVILSRWGEGPHTASLVFLPLAGLFFYRFLEDKRWRNLILAGLFIGLTALTNAVGFYGLCLLLLAVVIAGWSKKGAGFGKIFWRGAVVAILAYGLIAFWYNLSFVSSFFGESGGVLKNYLSLFPWGWVFVIILVIVLRLFLQKFIDSPAVAVSFVWFLATFLIVFVYYASAPPEFFQQRVELAPQALRLMTEVDMALSFLLASLVGVFISFCQNKFKKAGLVVGYLVALALVFGVLVYGYQYLTLGQKAVSGSLDLKKTGEAKIAQWLDQKVNKAKGERVYVAGNFGFYLNYFTNVWQLRGALYQAETHPWPEHIYYQINYGEDAEIALAWLKAANIKYLVVNTGESSELYKEFKVPGKFTSYKLVYHEGGDLVYEIPLSSASPAKTVDLKLAELKPPKKADDKKPLMDYVSWLEKGSGAEFRVVNNDRYEIKAKTGEGEGILVQMTYDSGFKAYSDRGSVSVYPDPLGFIILRPAKNGEQNIVLVHKSTWKIWLGYLLSFSTLAALVILPLLKAKKPFVNK